MIGDIVMFENLEDGFIEKIGYFAKWGYGTMVIAVGKTRCVYVQFTLDGHMDRQVIDEDLFEQYRSLPFS